MEGYRRKQRRHTVHREVCGVQDRSKRNIETRERLALGNKVKEEEHLEISGRLREEIGMRTHFHGPMDYAKTLKLRFRVGGDPDLPARRNMYTGSRGGEDEDAQMCPCGKAVYSRTHIVG